MKAAYPAVFHSDHGWWIEFPDFDGVYTQGDTWDEAMVNAKEALELACSDLDGMLPKPCAVVDVQDADNVVCSISIDL